MVELSNRLAATWTRQRRVSETDRATDRGKTGKTNGQADERTDGRTDGRVAEITDEIVTTKKKKCETKDNRNGRRENTKPE